MSDVYPATPMSSPGYHGPAQHTYTNACDGFHEPGPCKLLGTGDTATAVRDGYAALCEHFGAAAQSGMRTCANLYPTGRTD